MSVSECVLRVYSSIWNAPTVYLFISVSPIVIYLLIYLFINLCSVKLDHSSIVVDFELINNDYDNDKD